jgi:hypothetical protein
MQSIDSHLIHGLETIPDDELLRRLADLLAGSRHTEADLVAHIGEVDARRLYAREATPSMFVYCRTKREVDELVAELAPRRDVPASMRKLPAGRFVAGPAAAARTDLGGVSQGGVDSAPRPERVDSARSDDSRDLATAQTAEQGTDLALLQGCAAPSGEARSDVVTARSVVEAPSETAAAPDAVPRLSNDEPPAQRRLPWTATPRSRPAVIEPLSPGRYRVQFTASAELREKLRALMRLSLENVGSAHSVHSRLRSAGVLTTAGRLARGVRPAREGGRLAREGRLSSDAPAAHDPSGHSCRQTRTPWRLR